MPNAVPSPGPFEAPSHPEMPYPEGSIPLLDAIIDHLRAAQAVQVVGHVRPDGDCLGSLIALHFLLERWGIPHALAADKIPDGAYTALAGFEAIRSRPDPSLKPDLAVYLDCARVDRGFEDWTPSIPVINIDHHAGNTRYGAINWIEPACAATGEMIYYLARRAGEPLDPPLAEALLIALVTDTGSFRFANTGPTQHRIAAQLIEAGARAERIARLAFASQSFEGARLTGHVLASMRLECGGALAWGEIRRDTYAAHGGEGNCPENLADVLRSVRGVKVGVLFHEIEGGAMRINLRSGGDINVATLAARWGGGGHAGAAGIYLQKADYEIKRDEILAGVIASLIAG